MIHNFKEISKKQKHEHHIMVAQRKLEKLKTRLKSELEHQESLQDDPKKTPSRQEKVNTERQIQKRKRKIDSVQQLMASDFSNDHRWDKLVQEALNAIAKGENADTYWPRDTMFKFLQCMENFMENLHEYRELDMLARKQLMELHDT
jgi:hypothetical protein